MVKIDSLHSIDYYVGNVVVRSYNKKGEFTATYNTHGDALMHQYDNGKTVLFEYDDRRNVIHNITFDPKDDCVTEIFYTYSENNHCIKMLNVNDKTEAEYADAEKCKIISIKDDTGVRWYYGENDEITSSEFEGWD